MQNGQIFEKVVKSIMTFHSAIIGLPPNLPVRILKHADEDDYAAEGIPLRSAAEGIPLRSPRAAESFRSTL